MLLVEHRTVPRTRSTRSAWTAGPGSTGTVTLRRVGIELHMLRRHELGVVCRSVSINRTANRQGRGHSRGIPFWK